MRFLKGDAANRTQEWQRRRDNFRTNAFKLIKEILELTTLPVPQELVNELRELVKEALHSIFFMAKIMNLSLNEIFAKKEVLLEELRQTYEQPFKHYSTQVPQRHPMSCVLDMIVRVSGERNENIIKQRLQQINSRLTRDRNEKFLISTTMCVSQNTEIPDSVRYYGVSMSTSGGRLRDIMIAASCCVYWDSHVANAVMTYYPNKKKMHDFDGTFILPKKVRCQAFSITDPLGEKPPCKSCKNLFGFRTTEFAYGNCAEVESVSNLFKNEREIKEQSQLLRPNTNTAENRQKVRKSTLEKLKSIVGFTWTYMFYPDLRYT
ncbi:uncharacterized protein LOC114865587 [Betta splendens]|uniref:Uncharacterized protein LOC114865587 n=1 Tax=Betta splendens TaxID=158456 RepID=A0A9W2Y4P7_BETSP|nr:uncharacterized protein LOC114865587 [Betta splendens]